MSETISMWLVAGAVIGSLVALAKRALRVRRSYVRSRSEDHEHLLAALKSWTEDPEIVRAAYESGALTAAGLRQMRDAMGRLTYPALRAVASRFLRARTVRQLVAKRLSVLGVDRREAMKFLGNLAEEGREF